ncbi:THAP domain-containing protein 1 B-like [Aphis craccivora]|uniref:THAP domain-containing protein 1 B-like n=1 Tax=Aphis craccivora TaxID=307492 RepID=A0A6G0YRE3_APHCR|nr:THAP domain-containing protein 1 B-like [Aphis craccivora]
MITSPDFVDRPPKRLWRSMPNIALHSTDKVFYDTTDIECITPMQVSRESLKIVIDPAGEVNLITEEFDQLWKLKLKMWTVLTVLFPRKYSTELRRFAFLLHFHSCKAYDFVYKEFKTILSHLRTWSKQYTKTDANPGFTEESLNSERSDEFIDFSILQ